MDLHELTAPPVDLTAEPRERRFASRPVACERVAPVDVGGSSQLVLFRAPERAAVRESGFGLAFGVTVALAFEAVIVALVYLLGSVSGVW
jgi:hypothetical protein